MRRDRVDVMVGGPRQRELLALLLVRANEVVSSDLLIDELWGERPPDSAATALHGLVSQLRKALEPDRARGAPGVVLVTHPPGYLLRVEPEALDAAQFEELLRKGRDELAVGEPGRAAEMLRRALGLWRGAALAGADTPASLHAEAERLEELRLEALEERIDADLALGRDAELVRELEALSGREPFRERLRAQLMLALYRSGRQGDALEVYQETRRQFVDRLGIEPTPRLRELQQAILRQDPELEEGLPRFRPRSLVRRLNRLRVGIAVAVVALAAVAGVAGFALLSGGDAAQRAIVDAVAVVDPEALRAVDTIPVGTGPAAIVHGHGAVWVANAEDGTVTRIDPQTREVVAVIGASSPVDLAVGTDAIWVAGGIDGTVSRIDPEANDVVSELDLRGPDPVAPRTVHGIAAGPGGVWACAAGREVVRIDPATNRVTRSIDVGAQPLAVAAGRGAVWVATGSEQLLRIEPSSGEVTATVALGGFPMDLAVADDGAVVLVAQAVGGSVWLVDPASTRLRVALSSGGTPVGVDDVPGPGLWAATREGDLLLLDPALSAPPDRVSVGSEPSAVAVVDGAVWVTLREPAI